MIRRFTAEVELGGATRAAIFDGERLSLNVTSGEEAFALLRALGDGVTARAIANALNAAKLAEARREAQPVAPEPAAQPAPEQPASPPPPESVSSFAEPVAPAVEQPVAAVPEPPPPEAETAPPTDDSPIPDALASVGSVKDAVYYLYNHGVRDEEALLAECRRLRPRVPGIMKCPEDELVRRVHGAYQRVAAVADMNGASA